MRFVQLAEQSNLPRIVSVQNCYNLLARGQFDTDLAEVCAPRQCNVGLLAYSPLAGGALSGKYVQGGGDLPKARFNIFPGKCLPAQSLCSRGSLLLCVLLLQWLHCFSLMIGLVSVVIVSAPNVCAPDMAILELLKVTDL